MKNIGQVCPAPDGRRVAYTVSTPVMTADRSEFLTQIFLAEGRNNRQLTFAERSSTSPQWSPDGTHLAFLSTRSGRNQIYVLSLDGGEAERLTDMKGALGTFAWSPDGQRIAYTMTDPTTEAEEKAVQGKDDARWYRENPKFARLYVIPVARDAAGAREARQVTRLDREVLHFDWSPDGTQMVFSHAASLWEEHWPTNQISVAEVSTGRELFGSVPAGIRAFPRFSPDGAWIAFTQNVGKPRWATHSRLAIMPADGGRVRVLPESPDGQPELLGWAADGKRLVFTEPRGTLYGLFTMDLTSGHVERIDKAKGLIRRVTLDHNGNYAAFVMESSDRAPEVFQTPLNDFLPVQVSSVQVDQPKAPLGRTEVIHWKGADGLDIEGLLTVPDTYKAGQRIPLILNIHGGPSSFFTQFYLGRPGITALAAFVARGFAILRPNPRGSGGYGWPFRIANEGDLGGKDYQDLMAGVDKVIAMGIANPERLGVMGWSYGGFMTSWVITQTQRFKAACIGAAFTDPTSFNGTTDIPSYLPDYLGGDSWEIPGVYARLGAISQIGRARTPSLIQHCEGDERVPISQGYELYNALKRQGVDVRMLVVPRQGHVTLEPKADLKVMRTAFDWFVQKLMGGPEPASSLR